MNRFNLSTLFRVLFVLVAGSYFILPSLLISSTAIAADYYFDATGGSDLNDCQSSGAACKTLTKLNTIALVAGDNVYLKRGEMWRETMIPIGSGASGNPITFDAYGSGAKPIITGEDFINGSWINSSGSEYKISMATEPYILYENGSHMIGNITNDLNNYRWSVYSGNTYKHQHYSPVAPAAVFDHYNGTWNKLTQGSSKDTLTAGQYFFEINASNQGNIYVRANNNVNLMTAADGYVYTTMAYRGELIHDSWFYDRTTQELYVRLLNGTQPQTNEVGYASRSYNILLTNQSYLTFKNLQLDRSDMAGIQNTASANKNGFIFDSLDINYYGQWGIVFTETSGSVIIDGITVKDTNIIHGSMKALLYPTANSHGNAKWSAIQLHRTTGIAGYHNNILIQRVKISGGSEGSGSNKSAGRDGISVNMPTNYIVEYTEVTGIDHGIYAYCDGDPSMCAGIVWRYNYVHDISDDALWGSDHANSANPVMIYSNVIKNAMDICIGFSGEDSKLYVANNVCKGFYQGGIALLEAGSVSINNIIEKTNTVPCVANSPVGCSMFTLLPPNNYTINNNVYYDSTGTYGTAFKVNNTAYTFENWQALTGTPDANSFKWNPHLNDNGLYYSENTIGVNQGNNSICSYGIRLLHKDSVWPDNVITVNLCPENYLDRVDIGAYRIEANTPQEPITTNYMQQKYL